MLVTGTAVAEPRELDRSVDQSLTLDPGQWAGRGSFGIAWTARSSLGTTVRSTDPIGRLGAAFGVARWLTVGAEYAFVVDAPGTAGLLTVSGSSELYACGRLAIAVSLAASFDLDSTGDGDLAAGIAVRYRISPRLAVFTGAPWVPGPFGRQLAASFGPERSAALELPVGLEVQLAPRLLAYASTGITTIILTDPGRERRGSWVLRRTPVSAGVWLSVDRRLSLAGTFATPDLQDRDHVEIALSVRYLR